MTWSTSSWAELAWGQQSEFDSLTASAANRISAFNFCDPFDHILPFADGTVSALDRQHLWGMYVGIAAGAAGAVVAEPEADKGRDAGSGRYPQWWEGEWIIPGVTHYLPEKPPEDIIPLQPRVAKAKKRLAAVRPAKPDADFQRLAGRIGGLVTGVRSLERRAQSFAAADHVQRDHEAAMAAITKRYRSLAGTMGAVENEIARIEAAIESHKARILADDDDFLRIVERIL